MPARNLTRKTRIVTDFGVPESSHHETKTVMIRPSIKGGGSTSIGATRTSHGQPQSLKGQAGEDISLLAVGDLAQSASRLV